MKNLSVLNQNAKGLFSLKDPGVKANIDVKKDWDCMPMMEDRFSGLIMQVRPI